MSRKKTLDAIGAIGGIDGICDRLRAGKSYATIGKELKMAGTAVWKWVHADDTRIDLARSALEASSHACDEEAEHVLRTMKDVSRAREIAQHLRWRAKSRNPKVYGDKQQVELDGNLGVHSLTEAQVDAKLAALLKRADESKP